jgi:hypothetical protein
VTSQRDNQALFPLVETPPEQQFVTTREELFQRLVLGTPHGYVVTEGEYGPGRKYHVEVGVLMDAFYAFCDAKESS